MLREQLVRGRLPGSLSLKKNAVLAKFLQIGYARLYLKRMLLLSGPLEGESRLSGLKALPLSFFLQCRSTKWKKGIQNSNLWVVECKTDTRYIRYKHTKLKWAPPPHHHRIQLIVFGTQTLALLLWSRLVYILPVHLVIKWQWLRPWKLDDKISNAKGGGEWLVTDERKVKWIRSIIEMWRKGGGEGSVMNPFLNPGQTRVITAPHQASSKATHSSWRLPCLQTRNWKEGDRRDLTKPDPIPTSIEMSSLASRKKYSFSDDIWILCPSKNKNHDKSRKKKKVTWAADDRW